MTEPRLTPEESARLDRTVRRSMRVGGALTIAALALCITSIWLGDWRFAGTGGIVVLVALGFTIGGAALNSPEARKRTAIRLHGDRGEPS